MFDNLSNAVSSIWNNKIRSILTVLGVVIGVTSVTTLISMGQGLKNDVSELIQGFGTNVIIVLGGKINPKTTVQPATNPANFITGDILTLEDVHSVEALPGVQHVTPLSIVAGSIKYNDKTAQPTLFGTYPTVLDAFEVLHLAGGAMFTTVNAGKVIVLGANLKQELFGDANPLGKSVTVGQDNFEVIGTLDKAKSSSLFGSELDAISLIPFDTATYLNKNQVKIMRIITKAADTANVNLLKDKIHQVMLDNHHQEEDFSVLTQDNILGLFDQFLNLATTMISAIASISLVVGGIGIMNIMLVTVTERTREIGIRKAVGATKRAILVQFLTEALVITFVGALIGLGISFAVDTVVAVRTPLKPEITPQVILIAVGISVVIGVIFGLWPAIRAANKDPIDALRYE